LLVCLSRDHAAVEHPLAINIDAAATAVDPTEPSTTKWNEVEALLAETLHPTTSGVYVATVSKPGNLKVRAEQSQKGVGAVALAGMYTGRQDQLDQCVASARKRCVERGLLILLFAPGVGGKWTLQAIVKPTASPVPPKLAAAYPAASVINC
jgi:hypothetical protein